MNEKMSLPSTSQIKRVLALGQRTLPSFPPVVLKLLEITQDETASLDEISKVVESDPGVAARVLEVVNSAIYGLQRKIRTLPEAVVLLGFEEIKKLSMGLTVFHGLFAGEAPRAFDRLHFWRHSLSVAVLAMEIAKRIGRPNPDEAYIGGLLHDVGKIFLDLQGRRNYEQFVHDAAAAHENLVEKERNTLGLGHDDVGAFFCSLWQLPEDIVRAVKYHHRRFPVHGLSKEEALLISIVSVADFVCWTQGVGSFVAGSPPVLAPEIEAFVDFEKMDIINSIRATNHEMERISEFYEFVFPTPNQIHENLLRMNFKLGRANTKYFYGDSLAAVRDFVQTEKSMIGTDPGSELAKLLARARTVREVLDIVMFQIGTVFEPVHWSLLLKDPKSGDMVFTVVAGANKAKLQGARLSRGEGIVGYIMETGKPLVVEDVSKDIRISHRTHAYNGFEPRSYMGMQLKNENKVLGAIELINKVSGEHFTSDDLDRLMSVSEYASVAIERAYFNQALQKLATTDSLTGLKNRYSLERVLCNRREMMKRYGPDASLMIIDIDQFKRLNQAKGRQFADGLLKHLAGILKKTFRRTDDLFRYEGDKFIALLAGTDTDAAEETKKRILNAVAMLKGQLEASISIFVHSLKADHAEDLIHFLQERLIKDKAAHKDEFIQRMEENLQPFLEEEMKKQAPEKEKDYSKSVSLLGDFVSLRTGSRGRMTVEGLSLNKMGLVITSGQPLRVGDFLDISFHLDDPKRSLIERRVLVKRITGKAVDVVVHNPPPYAKELGFYLMN